jgi:hypothetical protein
MAAKSRSGLSRYLSRVAGFFLLPVGVWVAMILWDVLAMSAAAGQGLSLLNSAVLAIDERAVTALMMSVLAYAVGLAGHLSQPRRATDDQEPPAFFSGALQLVIALAAASLFALAAWALLTVTDEMTWPRSVSIKTYFAAASLACLAATGAWLRIR